jgi:hypothetical protein
MMIYMTPCYIFWHEFGIKRYDCVETGKIYALEKQKVSYCPPNSLLYTLDKVRSKLDESRNAAP